MAAPVTLGALTKSSTREEAPVPGDLYTLSVPILVGGVQRGTLTAQFFLGDTVTNQQALAFIAGDNPPQSGPRVRWDI
jgi:hypothetical protein